MYSQSPNTVNNNIVELVLYILTGYQVLGIVYLDQLSGARHTRNILSQYFEKRALCDMKGGFINKDSS